MVQEELGVNIAVCPRLQLISHTQQPSPFRELSVRAYIFIKKCIRSFIEVVIVFDYVPHVFVYVCGYTTIYIYVYIYIYSV